MEDYLLFTRLLQLSLFFMVTVICLSPCRSQNTSSCDKGKCIQGECVNGTCVCKLGWGGLACDHCTGRVRLTSESSYITDGYGNYSENNKCTWLIDPGSKYTNSTIRLRFHQFSTECGWDHLYIYDGDSVYSKLLAAYSGLIQQNLLPGSDIEEIAARSGKVYLYFYSDAAYNMSGFNISYRIDGCKDDCSSHGTCLDDLQICACNSDWTGMACETALCPNNCSGNGSCINGKCLCNEQHRGIDCSVPAIRSVWSKLDIENISIARASAASVTIADDIYISGGYAFGSKLNFLSKFNIPTETWSIIEPSMSVVPSDRYGHSLAVFQNKLYMFGGVVDNDVIRELWIYDILLNKWSSKHYNDSASVPVAVAGHVAHVVNNIMYVLFGHSPIYGYKNRIQEYHILNDTWYVPKTRGAIVQGGYGHASAYDPETQLIYVCGGYHSGSTSNYKLTDALYLFNPSNRSWTVLRNNVRPRYLHSAVVMNGLLLIFAGNTHNDTSISQGAKCYSPDLLAYDIKCNKWYEIHSSLFPVNGERYGHIAAAHTRSGVSSMYLIGGFNGIMLNNILKFTPGNCTYYLTEKECIESKQGDRCVWAFPISSCMSEQDAKSMNLNTKGDICNPQEGAEQICKQIKSCSNCLSTVYGCTWCKNNCTHNCSLQDMSKSTSAVVVDQCRDTEPCTSQHNCHMCQQYEECWWGDRLCNFINLHDDSGSVQITQKTKCSKPCYLHTSCENCTQNSCMWCSNKRRCVETNSYVASFIYGQCMEWTTSKVKCPATRCSDLHRCDQCQTNPMCGWCNDPSNTGIGRCMEGGDKGPVNPANLSLIDSRRCSAERWFFTNCPACQCNGHSTCTNQTGVCDGCKHMTEGSHCEVCQEGYYGTPVNGGNCSACECNGQADTCDRSTGSCNCRTRGVIGTKCDRCDEAHKYFGNPKNGGTCYYDLVSDYQFTFNLSKREDKFYTQINFMNIPSANDRDVDFKVNCSGLASLNISVKTKSQKEEIMKVKNYPCNYFRAKFEHRDYSFGPTENTTFLVYVYGFQTPFWLQISFSQFPKIDLVHFFVTFFSCFLSLLIIAAVLYKIKHKYDNYRRRQRMIVEMEEMASRPFSTVTVEIDKRIEQCIAEKKENIGTDIRKRKKIHNKPSQVALEPLHGQKAAVLTLLVQLPTADDEWTPNCSSGLAIASALVTFGHPRKQSVEHIKGEKNKFKKHTFTSNFDTCA